MGGMMALAYTHYIWKCCNSDENRLTCYLFCFPNSSSGKRQIGSNALARYVVFHSTFGIRPIVWFVSVLPAPPRSISKIRFAYFRAFSDNIHFSRTYSQLYRSSSFNSSGRSSNCDNTEDMYSDVSLEDVQDINLKVSRSSDTQSHAP